MLLSSWTSASLHINNAICLYWVGFAEQLISFQHVKSFYKLCRMLEYERFCLWFTDCPSEALAPTSAVLSSTHPVSNPHVLCTPPVSKYAGYHMLMLRPWLLYESFTSATALLCLSSEPSVWHNYPSAPPYYGSGSCHSFLISRLKSPSAYFSFVLKIRLILLLSTELFY